MARAPVMATAFSSSGLGDTGSTLQAAEAIDGRHLRDIGYDREVPVQRGPGGDAIGPVGTSQRQGGFRMEAKIQVAETVAQREAIYRLRYDIYVEEGPSTARQPIIRRP